MPFLEFEEDFKSIDAFEEPKDLEEKDVNILIEEFDDILKEFEKGGEKRRKKK